MEQNQNYSQKLIKYILKYFSIIFNQNMKYKILQEYVLKNIMLIVF